jgi:hypothetical protein
MTGLIWLTAGIVIGWITKIPFLLKWYKEFQFDKKHRAELVATIMARSEIQKDLKEDTEHLLSGILTDASMAIEDVWDRSDDGFQCQMELIYEFREKYQLDIMDTRVAEEREIDKCRNDVAYFMEKYCLINGDPIFLRDYQKDFLKTWANSKLKEKT